jgi:hypothetical protein
LSSNNVSSFTPLEAMCQNKEDNRVAQNMGAREREKERKRERELKIKIPGGGRGGEPN